MLVGIILLSAAALILVISFVCFVIAFYSPSRKNDEHPMPIGEIYEPYYEDMKKWQMQVDTLPCRDVEITSHDGLTLRGKYYEYAPNAPIELMFHGYRGSARSDLCGGVLRCFKLGRSVLAVDQRASGRSDGHVISFGINESRDCEAWVKFIIESIDSNARIMLTGISMGAATVMTAASADLPENVIGVIADCGYTTPKDIIKKVSADMKLPPNLIYPFIKLGARIFGGFDLDSRSPYDSLKRAKIPVIFIHGDVDAFVPYAMSEENYRICTSRKKLVKAEGAGHGLAYTKAPELYLAEITGFFKEK